MSSTQYLIPEQNSHLKLARLLVIISKLEYSSRKTPILDIEKLAIFEFLIKYPDILRKLKKMNSDKEALYLLDYEVDSIESKFPNSISLYNYKDLYNLLKILIYYGFIDVKSNKGKVCYTITLKGGRFNEELKSSYLKRVDELCESMLSLRSVNANKLKQMIKFIMGGMNDEYLS
ncbi:ABC-three component system middle component 4 [Priestia aryabhattai]|uniref:ABC-three component system middle component 4 n=1 Tax=Priestia aryabhattai TaxID=412384 RepID=UPI003D2E7509